MTSKKILVRGANGFIGQELCKSLILDRTNIIQVVRKSSQGNQLQMGSFSYATDWADALNSCEIILHLAGRAHVLNEGLTDSLAAFRVINVDATINLARQAAKIGVKRFIFISSFRVNGAETFFQPFSESTMPYPCTDYALSKLEAKDRLIKVCNSSNMV